MVHVAKPVLEADSHAKVTMRKKIRGLRAIEQDVLAQRRDQAAVAAVAVEPDQARADVVPVPTVPDDAGGVVPDYCAAVRGILNDGQGGPLHPPGLRMASALGEVRESLSRNLAAKKGGVPRSN